MPFVPHCAPLEPTQRAVHRRLRLAPVRLAVSALVERHHYVCAERVLNVHRKLGRHIVLAAVDIGRELDAVVADLAHRRLREHLKAAAVSQDGLVPIHKLVQAARLLNKIVSGAKIEMIGVGEHDLRARLLDRGGRQRLDRRVGADRHEYRGLDHTVRRIQPPYPRAALAANLDYFISESVFQNNSFFRTRVDDQYINIASPNEKNLYSSSTACLYNSKVFSLPTSALTNMIKVDCGR